MKLPRALALALVLVATPAAAGAIDVTVTGEGFDLTDDLAATTRTVLTSLHAFLGDELGLPFPARLPIRVRILSDRAAYDALAAGAGVRAPENTGGFFHRSTGGVVFRPPGGGRVERVLVHEAVHHLVSLAGARPPPWLNEGLAEAFEAFRLSGNALWLDPIPAYVAHLRSLDDATRPSVRDLLSADAAAWERFPRAAVPQRYSYGWALCAFLMSSSSGRRTLAEILRRSRGPLADGDVLAAVEARYDGGVERLEADWRAWWRGRPAPLQVPLRARAVDVRAEPACAGVLVRRGAEVACAR